MVQTNYFYANFHPLKKIHPAYLSLLSGLLFYACWPVSPFTFLVFIAFVPFLWMEQQCSKRSVFFLWTYLMLFLWNAATTWWVCEASVPGGISAIMANSLLMSLPLLGFYNVKRRMGKWIGYCSFIAFWMSFEWIHLNWELSWPWLTLGNVFATHPNWVQWYEISGSSGGSLWVLLVNLLIFLLLSNRRESGRTNKKYIVALLCFLLIPFGISYFLFRSAESRERIDAEATHNNIVSIQPNVDPWNEKFAAGQQEAQVHHLISLSESKMDLHTALVIWPETAIPVAVNEDSMKRNYFMAPVWDFLKRNPRITLLTGIEGFRFFR